MTSLSHGRSLVVGRAAAAGATDAVVLVPGFMGFGRIGRFYYFSESITAALRGALEARAGRPVVVVPSWTRATDSLAVRQAFLLEQLQFLCGQLPALRRLHLVGHSTGGVDAQLLTCDRPLADRSWTQDEQGLRGRIASVVAIAAPHHGTFLARSMGARFLSHPVRYLRGFATIARLIADVVPVVLHHPETDDLLSGITRQAPKALAFLRRVWQHRELIEELDPAAMARLRARVTPEKRVPLTSFVSAAALDEHAPTPPDPLFCDLYGLVAEHTDANLPGLAAAIARLRAHPRLIAGETTLEPSMLGAETNDGMVSSGLQLLDAADPHELGGIVVGDHGDVIGHYDRKPALFDKLPLNVGLFHSGSGFNDDAFFELYSQVAAAILRTIPDLPAPH